MLKILAKEPFEGKTVNKLSDLDPSICITFLDEVELSSFNNVARDAWAQAAATLGPTAEARKAT